MQPIEERLKISFSFVTIRNGNATCFANSPSVTALNFAFRFPRSVRGPVERLPFLRLASILVPVTVFRQIIDRPYQPACTRVRATILVARGLRILQDFAAFCRGKLLNFLGISGL
jgi:hypothetical protein